MIVFSKAVFQPVGHTIRFLWMLLVFLQIYVFIDAFRKKRSVPFRIYASLQVLIGIFLFSGILDGSFYVDYLPIERKYPAFVNYMYGLPWAVLLISVLILLGVCLAGLFSCVRFGKNNISHAAIKETVDLLPEGICFGNEKGTVVLANLKMNEWCRMLTGSPLENTGDLTRYLTENGEDRSGSLLAGTPDGKMLMFASSIITSDGEKFRQITASDVSEQYRITSELRENNARLRGIQRHMKEFSDKAAELAMSEEMLKARMTVHDEIGHVLLRSKYYLDHPADTDEENLLLLLKTVNDLMLVEASGEYEAPETTYENAVKAAEEIGVEVILNGNIPEDRGFEIIIGSAVRESAVNTVKHAGGNRLTVDISESEKGSTITIENNGDPPPEKISESGGLLSLRRITENAGGKMTVSCEGRFKLTLFLPKKV